MKLSIEGQDIELVDIEKYIYNKALNDVESEFLKCEKVHYNLQDILCMTNKLKAGGKNEYGSGKVCRLSD